MRESSDLPALSDPIMGAGETEFSLETHAQSP